MSSSYHPAVRVEEDGHVVTVTLDRPQAKNSCTGDMWVSLGRTFQEMQARPGVRAVVLTGAGGDFCAGADLGGGPDAQFFPQQGTLVDGLRVLADVVLAVHSCPVPVVAKVDGVCVGAGLGLALAADMIWCSDRARFCVIFAKRGLSLDFGTSWLLRQRLGVHRAKELAFTAKMLSAQEALDVGLVNAVVGADELDAAAAEIVDTIVSGPPMALRSTKRELDAAAGISLAQALEAEGLAQALNAQSEDMSEAMAAFAERRPARFVGR